MAHSPILQKGGYQFFGGPLNESTIILPFCTRTFRFWETELTETEDLQTYVPDEEVVYQRKRFYQTLHGQTRYFTFYCAGDEGTELALATLRQEVPPDLMEVLAILRR